MYIPAAAGTVETITDLPGSEYTFPARIAPTDLRPDVVLWSPTQKSAILVELTVCYKTNLMLMRFMTS